MLSVALKTADDTLEYAPSPAEESIVSFPPGGMLPALAAGSMLRGVDVSEFQGTVDWLKLKKSGIAFAFIKATEGATLVDPRYVINMNGARAAGIPAGPYHFFRPGVPVDVQVDHFVSVVKALLPGDLPPVLDVEVPEAWHSFTASQSVNLVTSWLDAVKAKLGMDPIVYMSPSFVGDVLKDAPALKAYALWVAHYTKGSAPLVPPPFPTWSFWQFSGNGRVAGINGAVDLDLFNGNVEQFNKFRKPPNQSIATVWLAKFKAIVGAMFGASKA